MELFGEQIRRLREIRGISLKALAKRLEMGEVDLQTIENNQHRATRQQVEEIAEYLGLNSKELVINWLSDQLLFELQDADLAEKVLKVAEERAAYMRAPEISLAQIKDALVKELKGFPVVTKAWLFGSFAKGENNWTSDIDIMLDVQGKKDFSLFDMFQIKHDLENVLHRKVDIVMKDGLLPFAWETAKEDLILLYDCTI